MEVVEPWSANGLHSSLVVRLDDSGMPVPHSVAAAHPITSSRPAAATSLQPSSSRHKQLVRSGGGRVTSALPATAMPTASASATSSARHATKRAISATAAAPPAESAKRAVSTAPAASKRPRLEAPRGTMPSRAVTSGADSRAVLSGAASPVAVVVATQAQASVAATDRALVSGSGRREGSNDSQPLGFDVPLLPGQAERVLLVLSEAGVLPTADGNLRRARAALGTLLQHDTQLPSPPPSLQVGTGVAEAASLPLLPSATTSGASCGACAIPLPTPALTGAPSARPSMGTSPLATPRGTPLPSIDESTAPTPDGGDRQPGLAAQAALHADTSRGSKSPVPPRPVDSLPETSVVPVVRAAHVSKPAAVLRQMPPPGTPAAASARLRAREALAHTLDAIHNRALHPLSFELTQVLCDVRDAQRFVAWRPSADDLFERLAALPTPAEDSPMVTSVPRTRPSLSSQTSAEGMGSAAAASPAQAGSTAPAAASNHLLAPPCNVRCDEASKPIGKRGGGALGESAWWSAALDSDIDSELEADGEGDGQEEEEVHGAIDHLPLGLASREREATKAVVSAHAMTNDVSEARALLDEVADPLKYTSPLLALRAYRVTPGFLTSGLELTAPCARARLQPTLPLCRFELRGECRASNCAGQHRRHYMASIEQMPTELARYAAGVSIPAAMIDAPPPHSPPRQQGESKVGTTARNAAEAAACAAAAQVAATHEATASPSAHDEMNDSSWAPSGAVPVAPSGAVSLARLAAQRLAKRKGQRTGEMLGEHGTKGATLPDVDQAGLDDPPLASSDEARGLGHLTRSRDSSQLHLLHAALRVNPAPSLLAGDLNKQLCPMLSRYRPTDAAALEATALDGASMPPEASRAPTRMLRPTIAFDTLTDAVDATSTVAVLASSKNAGMAADEHGGNVSDGSGRYWAATSTENDITTDAFAAQLSELSAAACWTRIRTLLLGGDARAAGTASRRAATRVLSRVLERRRDSAALWSVYVALVGMDVGPAKMRELLEDAVRQVPSSLLMWDKLAAMQPTASLRAAKYVRALHTICGEVSADRCVPYTLLPAALQLLRGLALVRLQPIADCVVCVLLAPSAELAAGARLRLTEACRAHGTDPLPPIPRIALLLPAALHTPLWLARAELKAFGGVDGTIAAATEAIGSHCAYINSTVGAGGADMSGHQLPWHSCTAGADSLGAARSLLDEGIAAVCEQVAKAEVAGAGKQLVLATRTGVSAQVENPAVHASVAQDSSAICAAAERRAGVLWTLRLNRVELDLAAGEAESAEACCRAFLTIDFQCGGARCDKLWALWARVLRAKHASNFGIKCGEGEHGGQTGDRRAIGAVDNGAANTEANAETTGGEDGSLLWRARLSEVGTCRRHRFEYWHALVLCWAQTRTQALQLLACAFSERAPKGSDVERDIANDVATVYQWAHPTASALPDASQASAPRISSAALHEEQSVLGLAADHPSVAVLSACSRLVNAWMAAATTWEETEAPEIAYLHLLAALWLQISSTSSDVQRAFEAAIVLLSRLVPAHVVSAARSRHMVWLRYLSWCQLPSSGVQTSVIITLLRRYVEDQDARAHAFALQPTSSDGAALPLENPTTHGSTHAHLTKAGQAGPWPTHDSEPNTPRVDVSTTALAPYNEAADVDMRAILAMEPARTCFQGSSQAALCSHFSPPQRRSRLQAPQHGLAAGGDARVRAWEAEACVLGVHLALQRVQSARQWELCVSGAPPAVLVQMAARAAQAGATNYARTALAKAIDISGGCEEAWTLYPLALQPRPRLHALALQCEREPATRLRA